MGIADLELFCRCASGFEAVLASELRELGMRRVRPLKGGVSFFGDLRCAYASCMWSRVATRVQLVLARVPASTADEYYRTLREFCWEDHVRDGATIAVRAHGTNAELCNTAFSAVRAKDAICDRLREARGHRPDVDAGDPDVSVDLSIHDARATVYLNLSGAALHRRGYREDGVQTEAPLKETLAAGMLMAAGWPDVAREGGMLVDPMCGSGTLAIEAALMANDIAPGLLRDKWGFEGWARHDEDAWRSVREEAQTRSQGAGHALCVVAGDVDRSAVEIARANVGRAGVADAVQLFCDDARSLGRHLRGVLKRGVPAGLLATNPPYGERLGTSGEVVAAHEALSVAVDAVPRGWRCAIITPNVGVDTALGREPSEVLHCYNGPIEVGIRMFETARPKQTAEVASLQGKQLKVCVADVRSAQFAARFRKVARERMRWAKRAKVSCLRLYDCDLPDYPLSVDLYREAQGGVCHAVVEVLRRSGKAHAEAARRRTCDAIALVSAVLGIAQSEVLLRSRENEGFSPLWVDEGGFAFEVDLAGRPDTGLPLELRGVRELMGSDVLGMRVANLGGTAGAASVYAAGGGAARTVTVEPFEDRAQRLQRVFKANGLDSRKHKVVCGDCLAWAREAHGQKSRFDVVLCAPASWLGDAECAELLLACKGLVCEGGRLVVACSKRDEKAFLRMLDGLAMHVADISQGVVPHDFERSRSAPSCYLLTFVSN